MTMLTTNFVTSWMCFHFFLLSRRQEFRYMLVVAGRVCRYMVRGKPHEFRYTMDGSLAYVSVQSSNIT